MFDLTSLTKRSSTTGPPLHVARQFADTRVFYDAPLLLWLLGQSVWVWIGRSVRRAAMEAIGADETAAGVYAGRRDLLRPQARVRRTTE